MKLVMTLLARNEADIVDANLAYHLNAGVDFVVATDNRSDDGTLEILRRYEREGLLHLLQEGGDGIQQGEWVTRMARLAASEFEADWVLNCDADEFWWPRKGSLKEVLARVPARYATVRAFLRNYVPRADAADRFEESMTARLVPAELRPGSVFELHPFQPQDKVLHRAHPDVTVGWGNHDARWDDSIDLRGFWPVEVLHFPIRGVEQVAHKWENWARFHYATYDALLVGTPQTYFESRVVDDAALSRGLEEGWLATDERLRDVLRVLRGREGGFDPHGRAAAERHDAEPTRPAADAHFAADVAAGSANDTFVKSQRQVAELEARVVAQESALLRRVRRKVVRSAGPG